MLTVNRLRLPPELRRSLACTNAIENMQGTIRRVTRNVKRWRDASMALRWAAAGMMEAKAGFRRLKAHRQLPALRRAWPSIKPVTPPSGRCRSNLPRPRSPCQLPLITRKQPVPDFLLRANFCREQAQQTSA